MLGLAFSIAVILSTIGIMDGFEVSLKKGLRLSTGDISIFSGEGFFSRDAKFLKDLEDLKPSSSSLILQTEGFVITDEVSRGVMIQGVEPESYLEVTGAKRNLAAGEVAIGQELARVLQLEAGDTLRLAFADGNKGFESLPLLQNFKVSEVFSFGVYQKDLRQVYLLKEELQESLGLEGQANLIILNTPLAKTKLVGQAKTQKIESYVSQLRQFLGPGFSVKAYWSDFNYLFEAVETEKFWIGMILQIVVVISIFNVLAFVIFVNEKRAREIFLLKALGLSQNHLKRVWYLFIFFFWAIACFVSIGLVELFNWLLGRLTFFQLPGDVYHLGRLEMVIGWQEYILVFSLVLIWLLFLSWLGLRRVRRQSVLYGLRREFA